MIVVLLTSAFIVQGLPILAELFRPPSYRRGRDFERWAYPDKTVRLIQYMGPRFVRHHATGEFVNLVFEDHYRTGGYYLVQNAYVGLKIYDNKTVMYDPDMTRVAVDEERFSVQVYDPEESSWTALNLTASSLRVDAKNSTAVVITRVREGKLGRLEITYIIRDGELAKYKAVFTSFVETPSRFRLVQRLRGIRGSNVTYGDVEGSTIKIAVNATKEFVAPALRFEEDGKPVLSLRLWDLGRWTRNRVWVSDLLKKITLDTHTRGVKAEIIMGDKSLSYGESLTVDPYYTTFPAVISSNHDTYVEKLRLVLEYGGESTSYSNLKSSETLKFGKDYEYYEYGHELEEYYYTHRTYLRWQILIPYGATIQSAKLKLCTKGWPDYSFTAYIRTLDFADCPEFTDDGYTIWNYPVMPYKTSWSISGDWSDGDWVEVDITGNLQDFVESEDYAPGNHMGLRIDEGTSTFDYYHYREVYSVDKGSKYAPRLEITFSYPYEDKLVEPIKNWSFEDETEWTLSGGTKTVSSSVYLHGEHSWYVTGSSSQDVVIEQTLSSELVEKTLRKRKEDQKRGIVFGFYYKPDGVIESGDNKGEKNKAGAEIYYEYSGGSKTVCNYTKPDNASKWWHAQVRAELPPTTTLVKVRIRGCPYGGEGFKAWIDLALLGIYYYDKNSTNYGTVTLLTTIYYSNVIPHPEWRGFVSLGASIYAESDAGYSVGKIKELKVELLPNDGTKTTQQARLIILEARQANSDNHNINPAEQEIAVNTMLQLIKSVIGLSLTAFAKIYGCAAVEAETGKTFIKALKVVFDTAGAGWKFYNVFRVDLHHPLAEGETDYAVWEKYDYTFKLVDEDDRVEWAAACYYFDWRYRSDSDDVFAIRVSATVEWYEWDPETPSGGSWICAGQTEVSLIISIVDY